MTDFSLIQELLALAESEYLKDTNSLSAIRVELKFTQERDKEGLDPATNVNEGNQSDCESGCQIEIGNWQAHHNSVDTTAKSPADHSTMDVNTSQSLQDVFTSTSNFLVAPISDHCLQTSADVQLVASELEAVVSNPPPKITARDEIRTQPSIVEIASSDSNPPAIPNGIPNHPLLFTDPLLLSLWPSFLWERTTVLQPLPTPEIILDGRKQGKQSAVVCYLYDSLRVTDNLVLQMALWLGNQLTLPIIVFTIISSEEAEDVLSIDNVLKAKVNNSTSGNMFTPHRSAAQDSYQRKSISKMHRLLIMHQALKKIRTPFIVFVCSSKNSALKCSSTYSYPTSRHQRLIEILQSFETSLHTICLLTDDSSDVSHESELLLAHHILPNLPIFMIDTVSVVSPKHSRQKLTTIGQQEKQRQPIHDGSGYFPEITTANGEKRHFVQLFRAELQLSFTRCLHICSVSSGLSHGVSIPDSVIQDINTTIETVQDWAAINSNIREFQTHSLMSKAVSSIAISSKWNWNLTNPTDCIIRLLSPILDTCTGKAATLSLDATTRNVEQEILLANYSYLLPSWIQAYILLFLSESEALYSQHGSALAVTNHILNELSNIGFQERQNSNVPSLLPSLKNLQNNVELVFDDLEHIVDDADSKIEFSSVVRPLMYWLIDIEYARYQYCQLFRLLATNSLKPTSAVRIVTVPKIIHIPWLHFLPGHIVNMLNEFGKVLNILCDEWKRCHSHFIASNSNILLSSGHKPHTIEYPRHVRAALTETYLVTHLPSPEHGIKTAIVELATHAPVEAATHPVIISTLMQRICHYTVPLLFICLNELDLTPLQQKSAPVHTTPDSISIEKGLPAASSSSSHALTSAPSELDPEHDQKRISAYFARDIPTQLLNIIEKKIREKKGDLVVDKFIFDSCG